jgi:hypothetical protein
VPSLSCQTRWNVTVRLLSWNRTEVPQIHVIGLILSVAAVSTKLEPGKQNMRYNDLILQKSIILMRSKVLTAIIMFFLICGFLAPCWCAGRCRRFGKTLSPSSRAEVIQYVSTKRRHRPTHEHGARTQKLKKNTSIILFAEVKRHLYQTVMGNVSLFANNPA